MEYFLFTLHYSNYFPQQGQHSFPCFIIAMGCHPFPIPVPNTSYKNGLNQFDFWPKSEHHACQFPLVTYSILVILQRQHSSSSTVSNFTASTISNSSINVRIQNASSVFNERTSCTKNSVSINSLLVDTAFHKMDYL